MLRTLRSRLIASHVGLLLAVLLLIGLVLTYVLESQVVLANLGRQLDGQAALVAELLGHDSAAWDDPAEAGAFVDRVSPLFPGHLALLTPDGTLLATSDAADAARVGQRQALPGLAEAAQGEHVSRLAYSQGATAEFLDVMVPVFGPRGEVVGIVRLYDPVDEVQARFGRLRVLTSAVLAAGLVLGGLMGLALALTIERPLARLTQAVEHFSVQRAAAALPEEGLQETRALAQAFRGLALRLAEGAAARERLLADITHELGRPLAALRAAIRALLDGAADEPALRAELLAGMDGEVDRLARLLDDLAALREQAAGPLSLARQPVALAEWLPALLAPWGAAAQGAGLAWRADLAPDLPELAVDPDRLGQALGNLLSNALKFTPRGGAVTVTSGSDRDGWYFRVTDTGPGIPPEEQAAIFEPFHRVPPDRRYPPGLGVGLAIAREIVRAHGGELTVESVPGRGATFTVRLPRF